MITHPTELLNTLSKFDSSSQWLQVKTEQGVDSLEIIERPNGVIGCLWRKFSMLLGVEKTSLNKISAVMLKALQQIQSSKADYADQTDRLSHFNHIVKVLNIKSEANKKRRESSLWYSLSFWKERYQTKFDFIQIALDTVLETLPTPTLPHSLPLNHPTRAKLRYFIKIEQQSTTYEKEAQAMESLLLTTPEEWDATKNNHYLTLKEYSKKELQRLTHSILLLNTEEKELHTLANSSQLKLEETLTHLEIISNKLEILHSTSKQDPESNLNDLKKQAADLVSTINRYPAAWKKEKEGASLNTQRLLELANIQHNIITKTFTPRLQHKYDALIQWVTEQIKTCSALEEPALNKTLKYPSVSLFLPDDIITAPPPSPSSTPSPRVSNGPIGGMSNLGGSCYLNSALSLCLAIGEYRKLFDTSTHNLTKKESESPTQFTARQHLQKLGEAIMLKREQGNTITTDDSREFLFTLQECGWTWYKEDSNSKKKVREQKLTITDASTQKGNSLRDRGTTQRDSREVLNLILDLLQYDAPALDSDVFFKLKTSLFNPLTSAPISDDAIDPLGSLELHFPHSIQEELTWDRGSALTFRTQRSAASLNEIIAASFEYTETLGSGSHYKVSEEYKSAAGDVDRVITFKTKKQFTTTPSSLRINLIRENPKGKICVPITFNEELDLAPFTATPELETLYELEGICLHPSQSRDGGHYLAIVKDPKDKDGWYILDDSRCSPKYSTLAEARKAYSPFEDFIDGEHTSRYTTSLIYKKNNTLFNYALFFSSTSPTSK